MNLRKVTIIFACLAVTAMFVACDKDTKGNGNNSDGNNATVIKPSEVITLKDAENILDMKMQVRGKTDYTEFYGGLKTCYELKDGEVPDNIGDYSVLLQVSIKQKALCKPSENLSDYIRREREELENQETTIILEGLGNWACMGVFYGLKEVYVIYGNNDYLLELILSGRDNEWKEEKLKKASIIADKHMKTILND